jgi:hypothetical protein
VLIHFVIEGARGLFVFLLLEGPDAPADFRTREKRG